MNKRITLTFVLVSTLFSFMFAQQVNVNNLSQVYNQDFSSLESSGATGTTLPNAWYSTVASYKVDYGSSNSGALYSYGDTAAASKADRALGSLGSGSATPSFGVKFVNNTGSHITSLTISFNTECWRLGQKPAKRLDSTAFSYNIGANSLNSSGWQNVSSLKLLTPDTSRASAGELNGNDALNRTAVNQTISGLVIAPLDTFWLKWSELNVSGVDDGLALDDLTVTFAGGSVPTCTAPTSSVSTVVANGINTTTVSGTFTAVTADAYLILIDSTSAVPAPVDAVEYNVGSTLGSATVIGNGTSTTFFKNGLDFNTIYNVYVIPYNNSGCSGGPKYNTTSIGNDTAITLLDACPEPTNTPTNLIFTTVNDNTISGTFNKSVPAADGYYVVFSTSSNVAYPLDSVSYSVGDSIKYSSFKSKIADISSSPNDTTFSISGLASGTKYNVAVIGYNLCSTFANFKRTATTGVSRDDTTTTGTPPLTDCIQPSGVNLNTITLDSTTTSVTAKFTIPASADSVMVLYAPISVGFLTIRDTMFYAVGSTIATSGASATVAYRGIGDSVVINGLNPNTVYKIFFISFNSKNCLNGPNYSGVANKTVRTALNTAIHNKRIETEYVLYPNPTNEGIVFVKFSKAITEEATIEIMDVLGRRMNSQSLKQGSEIQSIDISNLAKGSYLLNVIYKGTNHVNSFIIQ
ncbi:MAG TPA: T9SS type A sorting domain-containing protein [Chitinophagales bacterium]|jgi:hypothetical protein|nr:T9SS type A sorting domain-containing protein [Chitinophagales bacterium]HQV77566.1 T9SS type A sorting domain-containing protein [Chitinophagales bacterium]HQW79609.1 T9SS type A sorting domain-containing protein [Chitinophagales bacterium]HRB66952.1 T9SS type A sorting domain-containing protein [Chitinophagales bacterium]